MKKIILLIAIAAGFIGCSKSSNTPKPTAAALITGQWYYTVDSVTTYANGSLQNTSSNGYAHSDYVQFNTDGTGLQYDQHSGSKIAFTYKLTGSSLLLNYPSQVILGTTTDAKSQTAVIKTLTTSALQLYFDNSSVASGVTIRVTEAAYFAK